MTAYVFTISSLATGRRLGAAVIGPQARYASIAWRGAARLARPFVTPAGWVAIEREIAAQLEAGPLPRASAIVQALGLEGDQVLQYLSVEPIGGAAGASDDGDNLVPAAAFDERLRQAAPR